MISVGQDGKSGARFDRRLIGRFRVQQTTRFALTKAKGAERGVAERREDRAGRADNYRFPFDALEEGMRGNVVKAGVPVASKSIGRILIQEALEHGSSLHRQRPRNTNGFLQDNLEEVVLCVLIRNVGGAGHVERTASGEHFVEQHAQCPPVDAAEKNRSSGSSSTLFKLKVMKCSCAFCIRTKLDQQIEQISVSLINMRNIAQFRSFPSLHIRFRPVL